MAAAFARVPDGVKVVVLVVGVIAAATAQTLLRPRRPGHDSFSSEKPESVRPGVRTVDTILAAAAADAATSGDRAGSSAAPGGRAGSAGGAAPLK